MAEISAELKKDIRKYLSDIKRSMYCDRKTKVKFLKEFKLNLDDYLSVTSNVDFEGIKNHFGTPESIAQEFAANTDINVLKHAKQNKNFKWIIVAILATIALFIGVIAFIIVTNNSRKAAYYYDESVVDDGIIEETSEQN